MKVSVSVRRRVVYVITAVYLATHLPSLAPSLEDYRLNRLRAGSPRFRSREASAHPPGSPVYIALGRALLILVSNAWSSLGRTAAEALTFAIWSAAAGAILAAARIFAALEARQKRPGHRPALALDTRAVGVAGQGSGGRRSHHDAWRIALRYFDAPPAVRITAAGRVIARFRPDADLGWTVTVPADDLVRSAGTTQSRRTGYTCPVPLRALPTSVASGYGPTSAGSPR